MSLPQEDLEVHLRATAHAARVLPDPHLRERTMSRVKELPRHHDRSTQPRLLPAWVSAAAVVTLAAAVATSVHRREQPSRDTSRSSPAAPWPMIRLSANRSFSIGKPLLREARLLAEDAEKTYEHLLRQIPFNPPSRELHHHDTEAQRVD